MSPSPEEAPVLQVLTLRMPPGLKQTVTLPPSTCLQCELITVLELRNSPVSPWVGTHLHEKPFLWHIGREKEAWGRQPIVSSGSVSSTAWAPLLLSSSSFSAQGGTGLGNQVPICSRSLKSGTLNSAPPLCLCLQVPPLAYLHQLACYPLSLDGAVRLACTLSWGYSVGSSHIYSH